MRTIAILLTLNLFTQCNSITHGNDKDYRDFVKYWDLTTGSHIAYIHIPAADPDGSIPLIFLHGGPGACQVNSFGKEAPIEWYYKLAKNGYDVYLYDQVGSGLSGRLSDPAQYSVDRNVKDLEGIRVVVGNKPCILIGDSWGATLASHYIAKYSGNVLKAIFTSPGTIDFRDWNAEYSSVPRFPSGWFSWIEKTYGEKKLIRYQKLDSLMQKDINKAYSFAGDTEMDKLADEFLSSEIFKTCVYNQKFTKNPDFRMKGMGYWSFIMTVWNQMNIAPIMDRLAQVSMPVFILRGDADYLEPGIAEEYDSVYPNSTLIRIPASGHFIWLDQPGAYQKEIEDFLLNENRTLVWQNKPSMSIGRAFHAMAACGNKIYIIGGSTGSKKEFRDTASVDMFDVQTNKWESKTPIPSALTTSCAVSVDNKIYIVGGQENVFSNRIKKVFIFDCVTEKWLIRSPMNIARAFHCVAAINNKLYAIGGRESDEEIASKNKDSLAVYTIEEYDIAIDKWQIKVVLPYKHFLVGAVTLANKIYILSDTVSNSKLSKSAVFEEYNPTDNTFRRLASLTPSRYDAAMSTLDGKIYVFGGWNYGAIPNVDVYDPVSDKWERKRDIPYPVQNLQAVSIEDKILISGGIIYSKDGNEKKNNLLEYTPEHDTYNIRTISNNPR